MVTSANDPGLDVSQPVETTPILSAAGVGYGAARRAVLSCERSAPCSISHNFVFPPARKTLFEGLSRRSITRRH